MHIGQKETYIHINSNDDDLWGKNIPLKCI